MRTNSVLSYILLSLEKAGWNIEKIESIKNNKVVLNPTERDHSEILGIKFEKTIADRKILDGTLEFDLKDKGIYVYTDKGKILIEFDEKRFRPAEVPILLSDTKKIQELGVIGEHSLEDIIGDQLNYFIKKGNIQKKVKEFWMLHMVVVGRKREYTLQI
jgi:GDPmannose 4,6-dehydratase